MRRGALLLVGLLSLGCARRAAVAPVPPKAAPLTAPEFLVREDAVRAEKAGASRPTVLVTGAGAPGDNLGARLEIPDGQCVLVLARGSATIDDLDLFVYEDDGTALGSDETPEPNASVVVCPPLPKHAYVFARVAGGHGLVAVAAQTVPKEAADRVATAVHARGRVEETAVTPALWPGLEDGLAAHRRQIGGTWHDVRRVAVPLDPRDETRISAAVEAGQCVDLFAEPATDVAFTELGLLDADGRILAEVPGDRRQPALVVCSPAHAELTFSLRPHGGRGLAAVVLSVSTDARTGAEGVYLYEASADRSLKDALAGRDAELAKQGLGAPKQVQNGTSRVGGRSSVAVDVAPGCSRLDVVSGTPFRGVSAVLWSDAGALLDRDDGPTSATLYACTEKTARARLDIEAETRGGPFAVELRKLVEASSVLGETPLAGARVLRSFASPAPATAGRSIEAVTLSPTVQVRREIAVRADECVSVVFALGAGLEGPGLRVVDETSEDEIALVRRDDVASTSVCGAGVERKLRAEMLVVAGTGPALFAVARRPAAR